MNLFLFTTKVIQCTLLQIFLNISAQLTFIFEWIEYISNLPFISQSCFRRSIICLTDFDDDRRICHQHPEMSPVFLSPSFWEPIYKNFECKVQLVMNIFEQKIFKLLNVNSFLECMELILMFYSNIWFIVE